MTEPGDGSEERKSRKDDDEAGIVEEIIKSAFDKSLNMLENSSILKEDSAKHRLISVLIENFHFRILDTIVDNQN